MKRIPLALKELLSRRKANRNTGKHEPVGEAPIVETVDESELIAVITAAITSSMDMNPQFKLRIKSFRRVGQTTPIWSRAGRLEYISNKL